MTDHKTQVKREWVGKRIRLNADNVRQKTVSIIEELASEELNREQFGRLQQTFTDVRTSLKNLETALKDWDQLNPSEETTPDLEWRTNASEACREVLHDLARKIDASFPEYGMSRKLLMKQGIKGGDLSENLNFLSNFDIGKETMEELSKIGLLQETRVPPPRRSTSSSAATALLSLSTESGFFFELIPNIRTLRCKWTKLMKVTLKFSPQGAISKIRIIGDGENIWPSKFDVFRELERLSRKSLREFMFDSELLTNDAVTAKLLRWLNQHSDIFEKKCTFTHRFIAFGAVGENGQLEARPPMIRDEQGEVYFQEDLF